MVTFFQNFMKIQYRIKKQEEFQTIIGKKKSIANATFVLYYQPKQELWSRIGISVGKKIGNAVYRNKYKRQCRMILQETVDFNSYPCDLIIIVRNKFTKQSYLDNKKDLESLLNKVTIIKHI
ncbi:ribonuclease P protein component [Anaerorhabdus furcosa]|uniref:Ribonuclease P protein component n=1 Tax=Anaerorhabdus furcosa TaxID=118967 RepID=A0A1T4KSJ6_9FIRM|nr:ribonuclease P protein component [Anaerorhabdus furcosa]SJZ45297.1 ribonuclease P protein component [Anaerorhabdus furcosa]